MRRLVAGVVLALAATALSPAGLSLAASSGSAGAASEPASVPGQLLVGYRHGASDAHRAEARGRANAQLVERVVKETGAGAAVELVKFTGIDRAEATRRFTSNPNVAFAEPNWVYTHAAVSNDPYYLDGRLWGVSGDPSTAANLYGSQADKAWAAGHTGSNSVYVGIIDEGYQHTHPDLVANAGKNPGESLTPADETDGVDDDGNGKIDDVYGWDFAGGNKTVYDGTGDDHGTHVAGTIGASGGNGAGVAGVAWNVKLLSAKFLGAKGGTTSNAIKAVDYFTDLKTRHGLNIVATNNSWGGGGYSQGLYDAIVRANAQNILFIAAAGNDGTNNDVTARYPGNYTAANVISVAAFDKNGALASWSNYGATTVDLGAPGVAIWSTVPSNSYNSYSGTSMATPHVSGAVALYAAAHPGTAASIKNAVLGTVAATSALNGRTVTGGRLDVNALLTGTVPVPDPDPEPEPVRTVTVTNGLKKKAITPITVTWTGFSGTSVDLYRNTTKIVTGNDGNYAENLKGSGTVTYKVCQTGSTSTCAQGTITY
ncbi:MAG: S8 family peptidase [Acidimicrobiia bacterium]